MALWTLLEGHKVTEMRDGCVYRTKSVGFEWFNIGEIQHPHSTGDVSWGSISTTVVEKLNYRNIVSSKEKPPVPDWLPAYKEKS